MKKISIRVPRAAVMAGMAALLLLAGGLSNAQENTGERLIRFEIDAQELASALNRFAAATDNEILYAPELVQGLEAAALYGEFTPREALARLLEATGLTFDETVPNVFILKPTSASLGLNRAEIMRAAPENRGADNSAPLPGPAGSGTGTISGRVFDTGTGRGLPGAIMRLSGTRFSATTDARGRYRFAAVPAGRYRLSLNYIGISDEGVDIEVGSGDSVVRNFETGAMIEEIVVYGTQSSLVQALNQQRSASNSSTVVASDLLGSFPAETVAEALRRVPGVSFGRDEATGEGSRILVRGFTSEAINVQLNGMDLQGTGFERTVDLNGFLTDNISKVTIQKSLLPSHEATGTGGLVEIETRSGLDYGDRYFSFGTEREQSVDSAFGDELQASATVAWKFTDSLGIAGTVQYRETDRQNVDVGILNAIPPVYPAGYANLILVPHSLGPFPFDPEVPGRLLTGGSFQQRQRDEENLTSSLNVAWDVADHTRLMLDFQRIERDASLVGSRAALSFLSPTFGVDMPVPELGGEVRRRRVLDSLRPAAGLRESDTELRSTVISLRGETDVGPWEFGYKMGISSATLRQNNRIIDLIGTTATNVLDLIDPATLVTNPDAASGAPRAVDGGVYFVGDHIPILSLSQEGMAHVFSADTYALTSARRSVVDSPTDAEIAEFDVRYNLPSNVLEYVATGVKYDRSERSNLDDDFVLNAANVQASETYSRIFGRDTFLSDFSSDPLNTLDLGLIGAPGHPVPFIRPGLADDIFARLSGLTADDPATPENEERFSYTNAAELDPILNDDALLPTTTTEERFASYFESGLDIGRLGLVGGVRWEQTKRNAVNVQVPVVTLDTPVFQREPRETFVEAGLVDFVDTGGTQDTLTPSLLATWRHTENLVFRLGYFRSTINPDFRLMSKSPQLFLDLRPTNARGTIREANPDLQPSKTDNWDLDLAWYFSDSPGLLRAAFFYKDVSNNFTSVLLADEPDSSIEARIRDLLAPLADSRPDLVDFPPDMQFFLNRPTNGEGGTIYGYELEVIRQLDFLPGYLGGFSVLANVTYTDGDFPTLVSARDDNGDPITISLDRALRDQSRWSGTYSLGYDLGGFSGRLIYSYQTVAVDTFDAFNLNTVSPRYSTLDLRTSYLFDVGNSQIEVFLEGDDLLNSSSDADIRSTIAPEFSDGSPDFSYPQNLQFSGGRAVTLGVQARFGL